MRLYHLILPVTLPAAAACQTSGPAMSSHIVDRAYMIPLNKVWESGLACLLEAGFRVQDHKRDALGGEIVARRNQEDRVRVLMRNIDEKHTRVIVQVERGDTALAGILHERLAQHLGLGEGMGEWFGGISIEAEYEANRDGCVAAARNALRSMDLVLTGGEIKADEARIEARTDLSIPIGIKIVMSKEGGKALVTFLVGTEKGEVNAALARKLKDEFERSLKELPKAGS
jgi:hypothetical protein